MPFRQFGHTVEEELQCTLLFRPGRRSFRQGRRAGRVPPKSPIGNFQQSDHIPSHRHTRAVHSPSYHHPIHLRWTKAHIKVKDFR